MTPDSRDLQPLLEETTGLLKALSHPARLLICCQLRDGEMSVGDIETTLHIKQPILSRELSKLREAGLVTTRRESKVVFYRLASNKAHLTIDALCSVALGQSSAPPQKPLATPPLPSGGYGVFARTTTHLLRSSP